MLIVPSFMGRNNDVLDHILWKYNYEGQNEGNNGGNMRYDYGLYHRELGEQFLVLAREIFLVNPFSLICGASSNSLRLKR